METLAKIQKRIEEKSSIGGSSLGESISKYREDFDDSDEKSFDDKPCPRNAGVKRASVGGNGIDQ